MSLNNDRLVFDKSREDNKNNIPLDLASSDTQEIQKEKINGICFNNDFM
jgi:hypothetical protein